MPNISMKKANKAQLENILNSNMFISGEVVRVLTNFLTTADGCKFKSMEAANLARAGLIEAMENFPLYCRMNGNDYDLYKWFAMVYNSGLVVRKGRE